MRGGDGADGTQLLSSHRPDYLSLVSSTLRAVPLFCVSRTCLAVYLLLGCGARAWGAGANRSKHRSAARQTRVRPAWTCVKLRPHCRTSRQDQIPMASLCRSPSLTPFAALRWRSYRLGPGAVWAFGLSRCAIVDCCLRAPDNDNGSVMRLAFSATTMTARSALTAFCGRVARTRGAAKLPVLERCARARARRCLSASRLPSCPPSATWLQRAHVATAVLAAAQAAK